MPDSSKQLEELVAELIIEQKESRRELVTVFNAGFNLLADKISELRSDVNEMKGEITQIKHDVRSIDQRLARFEDEQVLPRLLDLEHRMTSIERKVA